MTVEGIFLNHVDPELMFQTLARLLCEQEGVKIDVAVQPGRGEKGQE